MENQNILLKKLSRIFPSSFNSCRSQTPLDVADSSILITKTPHSKNDDHFSTFFQKPPKPLNIYSKLPCHENIRTHQFFPSHSSNAKGRKCPPTKTDCKAVRNKSSSSTSGRWFTSSAATDVGFDFYSPSSSSGGSLRPKTNGRRSFRRNSPCGGGGEHWPGSDHAATQLYYRRRRRTGKSRRRSGSEWVSGEGLAVEKSSSDPYGDFMWSMVEMIVEREMFGKEDLDRLLLCFLCLNEEEYHGMIFEVFSQICQTLFCN